MIPTPAEKAMLPIATPRETLALRSIALPIGPTTRVAKARPIRPPRMVMIIDSIKNKSRFYDMWRLKRYEDQSLVSTQLLKPDDIHNTNSTN